MTKFTPILYIRCKKQLEKVRIVRVLHITERNQYLKWCWFLFSAKGHQKGISLSASNGVLVTGSLNSGTNGYSG